MFMDGERNLEDSLAVTVQIVDFPTVYTLFISGKIKIMNVYFQDPYVMLAMGFYLIQLLV